MVFVCHCGIVCHDSFGFQLANNWQILLMTPAWGGVFIFFCISGFLANKSYSASKIENPLYGNSTFLKKKFVNIYIPCLVFISLAYILTDPNGRLSWRFILKIITCTFNGRGCGIKYVGASWYVFVLMWLYVLTPVFYSLLNKWETKYGARKFKNYLILMIIIAGIGLAYRIAGRALGLDWYSGIYANVIGNLDLFICGMIADRMTKCRPQLSSKLKMGLIYGIWIVFLNFIVINCFFYYYGEHGYLPLIHIYKYVFPTIYLVFTCAMLAWNEDMDKYLGKNLMVRHILASVASYTFMFYLWHSIIFYIFANKIQVTDDFMHYLATLILGSIATAYVAVLMTVMNKGIRKLSINGK